MKKTSLKTIIAFFLLIIPYVFLIISWVLEFLPVDDLVLFLGFLGATLLFPAISICFTIPSVILQIISLCKQQFKKQNIIMLVFSVLSIMFALFYFWFILELGKGV